MRADPILAPVDVELLGAIADSGTVVQACRGIGITRDRGVYRLKRLREKVGRPVVVTRRGGADPGSTRLTNYGLQLLRQGDRLFASVLRSPSSLDALPTWDGTWHRRPFAGVRVAPDLDLAVGFTAPEGARVRVAVDPETIVVAAGRFPTSARNVLEARVLRIRARGPVRRELLVRHGRLRATVAVTRESVRTLQLAPGRRVYLYVKATAVHPVRADGR